MNCPVCTSRATEVFLTRRGVPVHQNLLYATEAAARGAKRGDLEITVCRDCGFVFNAAFDLALLDYSEDYDNNQTCSPSFNAYVDGLVGHVVDARGVRGRTIVEVGCGKGYFIRRLVAADEGNRGFGFDPSYVGPLEDFHGRLHFEQRFYSRDVQHVRPDAVVCRHVIEHVPDPAALVTSVREAIGDAPARAFFETPCVEWILRNEVIWDFFYEHCSLFSPASFRVLFERSGFEDVDVHHVFEGQYLWLEAAAGRATDRLVPNDTATLAAKYAAVESARLGQWHERVETLRARGNVAIWGAGAKGVTFANLIDPGRERIDCLVDLNPNKQQHFVPVTAHPIVDYRELPARGVTTAILMNPNYADENRRLLAEAGIDVTLWSEES